MTGPLRSGGIALLCGTAGEIRQVLAYDLSLAQPPAPGLTMSALLVPESRGKADRLFDEVRGQGAAFDWELDAPTTDSVLTLHVAAAAVEAGVLVVGAPSRSALVRHYADIALRLGRPPDTSVQAGAAAPRGVVERPVDLYEELSRINNELLNAQRTLAKAHAEQRRLTAENRRLYEAEQETRRVAEEAVVLRDQVLASVSHDLRTPLTTIRGFAQMLGRQAERRLPEASWLTGPVAGIEAAATKMAGMIDELLDAVRLQTGESISLHQTATDLVSLVRKVTAAHQSLTARHHIVASASVPAMIGEWDAARLERVLDNLLSNAVKYSPAGGEVRVQVEEQTDAAGQWAVMVVQDEGVGIPAADLPHLFERFRRGTNVAGRIAGIGLGLAGAKHLVEQHGGTISATSIEGRGSTFTVRLPLVEA
jgi:signal transduction histidine kinase